MSRFLQHWHGRLLTLVALLVSSFCGLRASIADAADEFTDPAGVVIDRAMDAFVPVAAERDDQLQPVAIGSPPAPVAMAGCALPAAAPMPPGSVPPVPGPRLGSARGPRAP